MCALDDEGSSILEFLRNNGLDQSTPVVVFSDTDLAPGQAAALKARFEEWNRANDKPLHLP